MTDQPTGLPPQAPPSQPVTPPPAAPLPPQNQVGAAPQYPAPQYAPQQPVAQPYGYVPGAGRPGPAPGIYFANNLPRFVAYLIDGFILSVVIWASWFVIGLLAAILAQGSDSLGGIVVLIGMIAVGVVALLWFPYWWSRNGQTPGLKVMHLKVVRESDGGTLSFGGGFLRLIGYWISAFVFYIGFLWILVDNRRQGWHDKIAHTYMIEVP